MLGEVGDKQPKHPWPPKRRIKARRRNGLKPEPNVLGKIDQSFVTRFLNHVENVTLCVALPTI
jgi:hypothetical protein